MKYFTTLALLFCINSFAQDNSDSQNQTDEATSKPTANFESNYKRSNKDKYANLRKREHSLSWDYSSLKTTLEIEGFEDSETKNGEIEVNYRRNFSQAEVGVGYGAATSDDGSIETATALISVNGRFNFIQNQPGNDFIPFAELSYLSYAEDNDISGTSVDAAGTGFGGSLGFLWFPLGEIFALEAAYVTGSVSGDVEASGVTLDAKIKRSGLTVGYSLYF